MFLLMVLFGFSLTEGGMTRGTEKPPSTVLRIGTTDRVLSANILLDSNLALFAHLSNPPLMKMTPEGKLVGLLVEEIQKSEDNATWTFVIKDDLFWSDGRKVAAQDVKFSLEYIRDKLPAAGWLLKVLREVFVADEHTVVLRLNQSRARLGVEFTTYKILPRHVWHSIQDPMRHTHSGAQVGCGPYFIERIDLHRGVVIFQKNPYWKGKAPQTETIEIHLYQNKDVLSIALEKQDIDIFYDYASSYPYPSLAKLHATGRFEFLETLNTGLVFLGLNLRKPPLSDPKFREALAYAIDYEEIIKLDALGYGEVPNRGFIPPSMEHFKKTPQLHRDLPRAKTILSSAGYTDSNGNGIIEGRDGKDIELLLLLSSPFERIGELVQDHLKASGIRVTLKHIDRTTWTNFKDQYKYDLTITRTSPWGMHMHAGWATGYFDARRTGEGVLHILDDPVFLGLCDEALQAPEESLNVLAHRIQDYYAAELPAVPLYWNKIVTPFNKKYRGWVVDPLYGIYNIDSLLNLERSPD